MLSSSPAALAARPRQGLVSVARRRFASASPLLVTTLLTGAIFLLPSTGVQHEAQASAAAEGISTIIAVHD